VKKTPTRYGVKIISLPPDSKKKNTLGFPAIKVCVRVQQILGFVSCHLKKAKSSAKQAQSSAFGLCVVSVSISRVFIMCVATRSVFKLEPLNFQCV